MATTNIEYIDTRENLSLGFTTRKQGSLVASCRDDCSEPIHDSKFPRQALVWRCGECGGFFPVQPQLMFIIYTFQFC
uniref:AsIV-cont00013-ORF3 n=1 Tax=Apophua simplicipes ichnovirus TaxID=1329648 RepID=S5DR31_9VIRU|nr:AsIV-cont00013-ORF3 [Apophua simplicipes ichnovirus]